MTNKKLAAMLLALGVAQSMPSVKKPKRKFTDERKADAQAKRDAKLARRAAAAEKGVYGPRSKSS
jgi:hypothetical protein